jgi:hypothetical protein
VFIYEKYNLLYNQLVRKTLSKKFKKLQQILDAPCENPTSKHLSCNDRAEMGAKAGLFRREKNYLKINLRSFFDLFLKKHTSVMYTDKG